MECFVKVWNLKFPTKERKRTNRFRRIFTVTFLLFLAPAGALTLRDNHTHLPNLTLKNLSKATLKIRQRPLLRFLSMIQNFFSLMNLHSFYPTN